MKKIFSIIVITLMALSLYAGNVKGKQTKVLKTQWFDIIYRDGSERTVQILKDNLDDIFEDVNRQFGIEKPYFRMPVVVVQDCEQFNAYFTFAPYNHIVLYDTAAPASLKVFSETIVSTLRHEITHAVSMNYNNDFWRGAKKVFGDVANPAVWMVSSGIAEGATVSDESRNGEGRLNDEFFWHVIKQAKLEKQFPSFEDVKGASDISPSGDFYYFNGAFSQYLINEYGREKYSQWWYKIVNMEAPSARKAFEKVYELPFDTAWFNFTKSIELPQIEINPSYVQNLTKKNLRRLYTSLTGCENAIAWADSGSVYYASRENQDDSKFKAKKLFNLMGVQKLSFSSDGRYLAVTFIEYGVKYPHQKVMVYDVQTRKKYFVKEHGFSEASIVNNNGSLYLVTTGYENALYKIKTFVFNQGKKKFENDAEIILPMEVSASDYVDMDNGDFAFIQREGMDYYICVRNVSDLTKEKQKLKVEQGMNIRYLSRDKNGLLFTWTKKGTFPRIGKLSINGGKNSVQLFTKDLDGGIYYPVSADKIYYISQRYRENYICVLTDDALLYEQSSFKKADETVLEEKKEFTLSEDENDIHKYNPFAYFGKGFMLPFSVYNPPYGIVPYIFGVTYYTGNPMDTESLCLSLGTDVAFSLDSALMLEYQNKTPDETFVFDAVGNMEFGLRGFINVSGTINVFSNIFLNNYSRFSFGNSFGGFYGEMGGGLLGQLANLLSGGDPYIISFLGDSLVAEYSNVRKTGQNLFDKAGITIDLIGMYSYGKVEGGSIVSSEPQQQLEAGLSVRGYIPCLLPIDCKNGATYNFPLILSADLLNSQCYKTNILYSKADVPEENESTAYLINQYQRDSYINSARAELVLYGQQVQKGGRWFFMNGFYISADAFIGQNFSEEYSAEMFKIQNPAKLFEQIKKSPFDFYYGLNFYLDFVINAGALANSQLKNSLVITILKKYSSETDKTTFFALGFNLNM